MSTKLIALILGAGPNVGAALARNFAKAGYSIALAARRVNSGTSPEGYLSIKADLSNPSSVPSIFQTVKSELGTSPNIVIYNAAAFTPPPDPDSLFSLP